MNREEILSAIKDLAKSKGLYGRILSQIEADNSLLDELERQKFEDVLDLIFFFEC